MFTTIIFASLTSYIRYIYIISFLFHFLIRIRKALENKNNMEDDRVAILEAQLAQAKLIAEEADKKYEEVNPPNSTYAPS